MADDKKKDLLNVDVGARAEAKLEVRTEIPSKESGRLVDALTYLLRPISENCGLRTDQIRLQREDVAIQISEKVHKRLALENKPVTPVPYKILLPWLEGASTEDVGDTDMLELWANLLASAATRAAVQPRYVGILKELQGRQAEKFERLARNQEEEFERPVAQFMDAATTLEASMVRKNLSQLTKLFFGRLRSV